MPLPVSPEVRAAVIDALQAGEVRGVLARRLGISAETVTRIRRRAGLYVPAPHQFANLIREVLGLAPLED